MRDIWLLTLFESFYRQSFEYGIVNMEAKINSNHWKKNLQKNRPLPLDANQNLARYWINSACAILIMLKKTHPFHLVNHAEVKWTNGELCI